MFGPGATSRDLVLAELAQRLERERDDARREAVSGWSAVGEISEELSEAQRIATCYRDDVYFDTGVLVRLPWESPENSLLNQPPVALTENPR